MRNASVEMCRELVGCGVTMRSLHMDDTFNAALPADDDALRVGGSDGRPAVRIGHRRQSNASLGAKLQLLRETHAEVPVALPSTRVFEGSTT